MKQSVVVAVVITILATSAVWLYMVNGPMAGKTKAPVVQVSASADLQPLWETVRKLEQEDRERSRKALMSGWWKTVSMNERMEGVESKLARIESLLETELGYEWETGARWEKTGGAE